MNVSNTSLCMAEKAKTVLLNCIEDIEDKEHAKQIINKILEHKSDWDEYQNIQKESFKGETLQQIMSDRKGCLQRMEDCCTTAGITTTVEEQQRMRIELLLKQLKPISKRMTKLRRMAESTQEEIQCIQTVIRLNDEVLKEIVIGLEARKYKPENEALYQTWRSIHNLDDIENATNTTAINTQSTTTANPFSANGDHNNDGDFMNLSKAIDVCDTCEWEIGFSEPRWRCMVCIRDVQCDHCHRYFCSTFHNKCTSEEEETKKTKSLGVICEYLHPSMRRIEAATCKNLARAIATTFIGFNGRPCLCPWDTKEWLTYQQVLQSSLRCVTKIRQQQDVTQVILCFPAGSLEFYLWDIACILAGITTIGIHVPPPAAKDLPVTTASHIVSYKRDRQKYIDEFPSDLAWLSAIVDEQVTPFDIDKLFGQQQSNEQPDPDEDSVTTLYFTSGTTGKPKLIPETRKMFRSEFFDSSFHPTKRQCTVSYLPHCWGTDRRSVYFSLTKGGRVGFAPSNPSLPQIVEALETFQPTTMTFPPTVANFLLTLERRNGKPPSDLGGKLEYVSIGGGPVPKKMPRELAMKYGIPDVKEGYGMTEVGGIASNGVFQSSVVGKVRLRDPLNSEVWLDKRKEGVVGELWIGDINTQDIVQLKNNGRDVRVIGRSNNAASFKLPNGKWCALVDIEDEIARMCCPDLYDEVMVFCNREGVLILLGVSPLAKRNQTELLRETLKRTKLPPEMRPKGLLLSNEPLPKTITTKIQRGKVIEEFQEAADRIDIKIQNDDSNTQQIQQDEADPLDVPQIASRILGGRIDPTKSFLENGGCSMTAVQLLQEVKKQFGDTAVSDWRSLLNDPLQQQRQASEEEESDCLVIPPPPPVAESANCFLLTGAAGFFGKHVLDEILNVEEDVVVVCLVRRASKSTVKQTDDRVLVVTEVPTGLKYRSVIHCAANVDHIKGYNALKADNVDLTANLLRLRLAPMIYCSTISTQHRKPPFPDGYTRSKWVSEQMVLLSGGKCFWPPLLLWGNSRDWLMRLIQHCLRTGHYPTELGFVVACPVEVASQDIIAGRPCSAWDLDLLELFMHLRIKTGMQPVPLASFLAELQTDKESPAHPALPLFIGRNKVGNHRSPSLDPFPIDWPSVWRLLC